MRQPHLHGILHEGRPGRCSHYNPYMRLFWPAARRSILRHPEAVKTIAKMIDALM